MNEPSEQATGASAGQAFLIGPDLYLRPLEIDDATIGSVWRPQPFPAPSVVVEEQLRKQLEIEPDDEMQKQRLLICRRSDDRVLGSVYIEDDWVRLTDVTFAIDPLRSFDDRAAIAADVCRFLVPYLLGERNAMRISIQYDGFSQHFDDAMQDLGLRLGSRCREAVLIEGERLDRYVYEGLHPGWIERIGMPRGMEEGPETREVRQPGRLHPLSVVDGPANALVVGERLYLRPFEVEEGKKVALWSRQETEIFWTFGRWITSGISYGHFHKEMAEKEPPSWIRFAIVLKENDELIGGNGVLDIDWVNRTAETESEIFKPEHRNGGFGTEAKHLLLEYAFQTIGLHMVYSWVAESNKRSAAALRKQGYRDAGYFAWDSFSAEAESGFTGDYFFDLLASEWRAARR